MRGHRLLLMVLIPRTMDALTSEQMVIPCAWRQDPATSVETFTCETTHGSRLVPQNQSWLPQVKDGDIRVRWTSLAPASDGTARSAAVNVQAWPSAHYLVSRWAFEQTSSKWCPRQTLRSAYDTSVSRKYEIRFCPDVISQCTNVYWNGLSSTLWSSAAVIQHCLACTRGC